MKNRLLFASIILYKLTTGNLASGMQRITPSDLAIVIPKLQTLQFDGFKGDKKWGLLDWKHYLQIKKALEKTAVSDALDQENSISDWKVVSTRVEPCEPLTQDIRKMNLLCWPQIRVVIQPISLRAEDLQPLSQTLFADSRAIHAKYTISPYGFLDATRAERADFLISKLKQLTELTEEELSDFIEMRNKVAEGYLREVLHLRGSNIPVDDYNRIVVRPEFENIHKARFFTAKFTNFLKRHAFLSRMEMLTIFSIPEGKDPLGTNTWVFKSFALNKSNMRLEDVEMTMRHKNGRLMARLGLIHTVSIEKDDPLFYSDDLSDGQKRMFSHHVVLNPTKQRSLLARISSPAFFLTEHTSCASCHKLNQRQPENFHAMSYFLEESKPSISSRTRSDVLRAINWIKEYL